MKQCTKKTLQISSQNIIFEEHVVYIKMLSYLCQNMKIKPFAFVKEAKI